MKKGKKKAEPFWKYGLNGGVVNRTNSRSKAHRPADGNDSRPRTHSETNRGKRSRRQKKEPPRLTIFISYASEDLPLAHGIANALSSALPEGFTEIYFDKWALTLGEEFRAQLIAKLEKTKYLVIVSTGVNKEAYAFPAWEVGFFEGLLKRDPMRRIIPLYLEHAPPSVAGFQGCNLEVPLNLLPQSVEEFSSQNEVSREDPLLILVQQWQYEAGEIMREFGFDTGPGHSRKDAISTVKAIRLAVFSHMKSKIAAEIRPQKQITIKSTGADLQAGENNLPGTAMVVPKGGNSMSIFDLKEEEMSWDRFQELTAGPHQASWREAITSVILSGYAERINVDNSQIILSFDESQAYRIVLTAVTKYWDDRREFSLCFVERVPRPDYGDEDTTQLLKGLQTLCRYRFLFLERQSVFSAENVLSTPNERFPQLAAELLGELNLMRQESRIVDLPSQAYWTKIIGGSGIREMREDFRPREDKVRDLCGQALKAKNDPKALDSVRTNLYNVIKEMEQVTLPFNSRLVKAIGEKLLEMVADSGRKPKPGRQAKAAKA